MIDEEGVERRGPWRGERDPIPRFLDELKMLFFVKFSELALPAEGAALSQTASSRSVRTEARLRTE